MRTFATKMDDFRIASLQTQVVKPGTVRLSAEQLAKIRPLNDLDVRQRDQEAPRGLQGLSELRASRDVRRALRGHRPPHHEGARVESMDDPLLYTDDQLVEGLAQIFEAAGITARPATPRSVITASSRPGRSGNPRRPSTAPSPQWSIRRAGRARWT